MKKGEARSHYHVHVGQRNIKTALAVTLCALIYLLIHRNPAFACIGAIFGMGSDMPSSRLSGGNRFFGTVLGGLLGMGLFRLYLFIYPNGEAHWPMLFFVFIGVVLLILFSQIFGWVGAVQPGGVVLCLLLFSISPDNYIPYCINRIIDTGVGVLAALLINWALPKDRVDRWLRALGIKRGEGPREKGKE